MAATGPPVKTDPPAQSGLGPMAGLDTGPAHGYTAAVLRVLLILAAALALHAGDSANPLDQAEVVLQVRDGNWVDREATRFAAAYGGDLQMVRGELARALYCSNSFGGIDLTRPALFAWRAGNAPLLAVVPLSDRTQFLESFGAVASSEPPLVRTGERDGTVIYTQNQPGGLWEYRLLVAANTAYIARSNEECRRLANAVGSPVADPFAPPLELTLRRGGLDGRHLPGREWLATLPDLPIGAGELATIPGLLSGAWRDLAAQLGTVTVTARSGAQGDLQVLVRTTARSDTALAGWIGQQRPGTERLAGQLRTPATSLLITGHLAFQGQLERWAFDQADAFKATARSRWSDGADTSFRGLCTLVERAGGWALAIERSAGGMPQYWVAEHPRAVEVAQAAAEVTSALVGQPAVPQRVGEGTAFTLGQPGGALIYVAGERHVARIDDGGGKTGLAEAGGQLLKRLDAPGSLDAEASLVSLWIDLAQMWRVPPPAEQEHCPPLILAGILRPTGPATLEFTCTVPIAQVAQALGRLHKTLRRE